MSEGEIYETTSFCFTDDDLLGVFGCHPTMGGWELVGTDGESEIYADRATIRKKGNFVEMWRMSSYLEAKVQSSGEMYKSVKTLDRYDCKDETVGSFSIVQYSEEYGKGDIIFSGTIKKNEINNEPIVPGSAGEKLWKIACRRK